MDTNPALKMDSLVYLHESDLLFLCQWSRDRKDVEAFGQFPDWLETLAGTELVRRSEGGSCEAGLVDGPFFDAKLLSDGLLCSYSLSRLALNESLARFADELEKHVVCSASSMLGEIASKGFMVCE